MWRDALILKLLISGIKDIFFGLCTSCIRSERFLSQSFNAITGVKLGDLLSLNRFNLYVNNFPDIFEK